MVTNNRSHRKPSRQGAPMDELKPKTTAPPPTADELHRDYAPRIYNLARRMLGNDADAEDVTQEVLLQVLRKLHTFRGESSFSTWLHRITVNAALAQRHKRARRDEQPLPDVVDHIFAGNGHHHAPLRRWSVTPDQQVLDQESQRIIEEAIARLPEAYRDIYVLADVESLPNAEIADLLGLPLPAVKSRLHRARLTMRDALAPYFEEVAP
jgi:RNA polymerase sigma-70 factor (ECF subfamily)